MSELWKIRYRKEYQGDSEHKQDEEEEKYFALPCGNLTQYGDAVRALCQETMLREVVILEAHYMGEVVVEEEYRFLTDGIFPDEQSSDDICGQAVLGWIVRWYKLYANDQEYYDREAKRIGICGLQDLRGIVNAIESRLVGE